VLILASGPELQAVYFGHVIQTGNGEKRGLALSSFNTVHLMVGPTRLSYIFVLAQYQCSLVAILVQLLHSAPAICQRDWPFGNLQR
jgi:hypothetical protein